jgi:hypothetical protein
MLQAMCKWSVHDFLAFRLFARCVTKGHKGCPPCDPTTKSRSSKKLKKIIYCGSHHYLPKNHPYWCNKNDFNDKTIIRNAPTWVFTSDTIKWTQEQELWLKWPKNRVGGKLDPIQKNGIKCLSSMFKLPYWEV